MAQKGKNVNQNVSSAAADKSFYPFLSFVQVALSRVMPLKCQLSAWACVALDMKYSSPHTKTAVSRRVVQKEIKYGACTSFSLEAPCTYYLSEWQMFFKRRCLMCVELLPRLCSERRCGRNLHGPTPCAARLSAGRPQRQRLSGWSSEVMAMP